MIDFTILQVIYYVSSFFDNYKYRKIRKNVYLVLSSVMQWNKMSFDVRALRRAQLLRENNGNLFLVFRIGDHLCRPQQMSSDVTQNQ